jgi:hypothetical protein
MEAAQTPAPGGISSYVDDAVGRARAYAAKYRSWDIRLLVVSIVFGALATLLATGVAAGGGQTLDKTFGNWRYLCLTVAALTAVGTVAGTLHKSLQVTERVADADKCVSRLDALKFSIGLGVVKSEEAARVYAEIVSQHPRPLA